MALDVALPAPPRTRAHPLAKALTARVGLTAIVACSFLLRAVAAAAHATPRYFPDEYIYASIARSLGEHGVPLVRGQPAHFPALLEPILAAPFWALWSAETAYRLTQLENALFMSLAAVPVYLLARRLSLSAGYALACAAFAVALPDLVYAAYTLADPVAYPLALGAVYAGVVAVQSPSRRAQLAFVALAGLATFARVQYVVLPAAFLVAALAVDRRRVVRTQRLLLLAFALPVAGALALGPSKLLGYYASVADLHVGLGLLRWAGTDLFLLTLCAGVVLVPGALAGLARARGRAEVAFAAFGAVFASGLVLEAALYAANGSSRFQERYLFAVLPLVPVAFGLYLKHGRPWRLPVTLVSVALLTLSARVPVSGYAAALGKTDSPFLFAAFRLERSVGTANASVIVAALAASAALGAIAVAWRGGARVAIGATLAVTALVSIGATMNDVSNARDIRRTLLPANPSWIDARGLDDVTLVQTAGSPPAAAIEQLYWNRSVRHEVLLGDARPTDAFAAPRLRIGRDGSLLAGGQPLRTPLLFQSFAASGSFDGAVLLGHAGTFSLLEPDGTPRLRLLEQGRFWDGWLGRTGRLMAWPDASGRTRGVVSFTLSLPWTARPTTVEFGRVAYRIEPGEQKRISYTVDARGPWSLAFHADGGSFRPDLRAVSVLSTRPRFARAGERRRASTIVS